MTDPLMSRISTTTLDRVATPTPTPTPNLPPTDGDRDPSYPGVCIPPSSRQPRMRIAIVPLRSVRESFRLPAQLAHRSLAATLVACDGDTTIDIAR